MLIEFIKTALSKCGIIVLHKRVQLWDYDAPFTALWGEIREHTIVDKLRCFIIYQLSKTCALLPGDAAEIGVYKGGTAKLLAKILGDHGKTVHLFDTFTGMPQTDPGIDLHRKGDFADTLLEKVKSTLNDCSNIRFYPGIFPQTAGPVKARTFCLVHVDVDIYASVKDCCEFFYPRMENGGIMIFDDYGLVPGARKAVDDFFLNKEEKPIYLPTGQCLLIRKK